MVLRSKRTRKRVPDRFERRMVERLLEPDLTELRPKNHGVLSIVDFSAVASAVAKSPGVKVLYLQAQELLDDEALAAIAAALVANPQVTGINLGELAAVSPAGWADFVAAVPSTALIDCYAQQSCGGPSEAVGFALKMAIMRNRERAGALTGKHPSMWRTADYGLASRPQ